MKIVQGILDGREKKFGIAISRFNEFVTGKMLDGAVDMLKRHNVADEDITIVWCPGAFELPLVALRMAKTKKYDAIICLGTVIRGDTPHFEYICSEVSKGISRVMLDTQVPVIFGMITADTLEQAIDRAGTKAGNKGADAALSAIEMCNLEI